MQPVEALAQRRERDRVGQVFFVEPARPDPEVDAPAAHRVHLGHRDRQRSRIAERRGGDQGAEPDGGRFAGDGTQGHPGVGRSGQAVTAHRDIVVGAEERGVAEFFGLLGHRELVGVGGALLGFDEDTEVHAAQLRTDGRDRRRAY